MAEQAQEVSVRLRPLAAFAFSNAWPLWVLLFFFTIGVLCQVGWVGQNWTAVGAANLSPSAAHWLGSNGLGQDLSTQLAQSLAGLLRDVLPGAVLGFAIAIVLGLCAGFQADTWIDRLILFVIDTFEAMPSMLLLIMLASVLKQSALALPLIFALLFWASAARAVRSACIDTLKHSFIDSARLIGLSNAQIATRQVLPNLRPLLIAWGLVIAGNCLRVQLVLGFLGLDRSAKPNLGGMLNSGTEEALSGRWWPLCLALFVSALILVSLEFLARRARRSV
jgi:peptide/nickel transport system permease protein